MKLPLLVFYGFFGLSLTAQTTECHCCTEQHQAFDFWVGSWEVKDADAKVVGYSEIEKIQDNCILLENWKSANQSYTGTSYNFYNQHAKQWEQLWLDNQGQVIKLKGHKVGNTMILESESSEDDKGNLVVQRITWTANTDGTVRQLWETITNGDKVVIAFDGIYSKTD